MPFNIQVPEVDEVEGSCRYQPSILMHLNINHDEVEEYKVVWVSPSNVGELNKLIADGWTMFRMQTEFAWDVGGGHQTMAYLAKMKKSATDQPVQS